MDTHVYVGRYRKRTTSKACKCLSGAAARRGCCHWPGLQVWYGYRVRGHSRFTGTEGHNEAWLYNIGQEIFMVMVFHGWGPSVKKIFAKFIHVSNDSLNPWKFNSRNSHITCRIAKRWIFSTLKISSPTEASSMYWVLLSFAGPTECLVRYCSNLYVSGDHCSITWQTAVRNHIYMCKRNEFEMACCNKYFLHATIMPQQYSCTWL